MSLESQVREEGLLRPGAPVVVLLSGGADSVCLLDLAVRVSGAVRALHVDYGLRDSAAADAAPRPAPRYIRSWLSSPCW